MNSTKKRTFRRK